MVGGGDGSAEAVGMPGGATEDVPVCLVLGSASVTAIEKKKKKGPKMCFPVALISKLDLHQEESDSLTFR